MPRSLWTGAISFGLVNIPVKLYSATSPKDVRFHLLHDADGVRIQTKRVCPADGEEVPYEHLIKGYEIAPDRYVPIDPKELEALAPEASHAIDIEDFVSLDEIDPLYYERSYYVVPDKTANKAYALLHRAMSETRRVAIARMVMRTKQYLVAIRPRGKALALSTLLYADEVVAQDQLPEFPDAIANVNERELKMAQQLIDSLSGPFDAKKYRDDYRERVLELIERKAEGEPLPEQPEVKQPAKVINLMEALEASLAASKKKPPPTPPASGRRARRGTTARARRKKA